MGNKKIIDTAVSRLEGVCDDLRSAPKCNCDLADDNVKEAVQHFLTALEETEVFRFVRKLIAETKAHTDSD